MSRQKVKNSFLGTARQMLIFTTYRADFYQPSLTIGLPNFIMNRYWLLLIMCVWMGVAQAQTIYGGSLFRTWYTENGISPPDKYSLNLHFWIGQNDFAKMPDSVRIFLYRTSDRQLMKTFKAGITTVPLGLGLFQHSCRTDTSATLAQIVYVAVPELKSSEYTDPNGYYFVNEPIGKRPVATNHNSASVVVYHWFSPAFLFGQPDGSAPGKTSIVMLGSLTLNCLNTKQGVSFYTIPNISTPVAAPPLLDVKIRLINPLQGASNGLREEVNWKPGYSSASSYPGSPWTGTYVPTGQNGFTQLKLVPGLPVAAGVYTVAAVAEQWSNGVKLAESMAEQTVIYTTCPKIDPPTVIYSKSDGKVSSTPPRLCTGQSLTIAATNGQTAQQYTWYKDGQPIPNQTTSLLTVSQPGTYSLHITKTGICDTLKTTMVIPAAPVPTVSLASNASAVSSSSCNANTPVNITAVTSADVIQYNWYAANNQLIALPAGTTVLSVQGSGTFTVRVKNADGCESTASTTVTYPTSLTATILPPATTTFCAGGSGILKAQANPGNTYEWFRDGQTTGVTIDSIRTIATGQYTVKVTNPAGCTALSLPVGLNAIPVPVPAITGDTILCLNQTLTLNASPATAYHWFRDGQSENATLATYTISLAGKYAVRVTYANGCTAVSPGRTIWQVEKMPVLMDSIAPICLSNATPITLRATPAGGTFVGQGVVNNQFIPQIAGAGSFPITYQPNSTSGCPSGPVQRVVIVRPVPAILLPNFIETSAGQPIILPGNSGTGYQYQWSPPLFLDNPALPTPTSTPANSITYRLTVTDSFGCSATDTIRVEVAHGFYIPTAFTPNGDGINDSWKLTGIGDYPQLEVMIYNRWGEVVFYSSGYVQPFEGRYLGEPLPVGIYTYVIHLKPGAKSLRGKLTLLR